MDIQRILNFGDATEKEETNQMLVPWELKPVHSIYNVS